MASCFCIVWVEPIVDNLNARWVTIMWQVDIIVVFVLVNAAFAVFRRFVFTTHIWNDSITTCMYFLSRDWERSVEVWRTSLNLLFRRYHRRQLRWHKVTLACSVFGLKLYIFASDFILTRTCYCSQDSLVCLLFVHDVAAICICRWLTLGFIMIFSHLMSSESINHK